jgi:hypothetical protein
MIHYEFKVAADDVFRQTTPRKGACNQNFHPGAQFLQADDSVDDQKSKRGWRQT